MDNKNDVKITFVEVLGKKTLWDTIVLLDADKKLELVKELMLKILTKIIVFILFFIFIVCGSSCIDQLLGACM